MLFKKYMDGEITASEAKLELILTKLKDKQNSFNRLDYLCKAIDIYEKRIIRNDIIDILKDIEPLIRKNYSIMESLKNDNVDISHATISLIKRFKTTQELSVIAGLVILSIAARMPLNQSKALISQARNIAFSKIKKVVK